MNPSSDQDSAIRGLCPACNAWFPCDEWFDRTVPVPCCATCRLPPRKLVYTGPSAGDGVTGEVRGEVWLG